MSSDPSLNRILSVDDHPVELAAQFILQTEAPSSDMTPQVDEVRMPLTSFLTST
jgi:hypothetical protein